MPDIDHVEPKGLVKERPFTVYCAASIGAFFLSIGDLLKNEHSATTIKIGEMLKQHVYPGLETGTILGLIFIVVSGCLVCWLYQPYSRIDAFARGFSVFAILTVTAPYEPVTVGLSASSKPVPPETHALLWPLQLIGAAHAAERIRSPERKTVSILVKDQHGNAIDTSQVVTIRDPQTYAILGREKIMDNQFRITRPAGEYIIEIEASGYRRSTIKVDLAAPEKNYEIVVQTTAIPLPVQRLYAPQSIKLKAK